MNYFANKEYLADRATFLTKYRDKEYKEEIENSVNNTLIFNEDDISKSNILQRDTDKIHTPNIMVVRMDSVSTIFNHTSDNERVAVLNFASYKHPGGMFILGSSAQEESLCYSSILYNVLSSNKFRDYYDKNNKDKNRGLYYNRALYSQNVMFFDNRQNAEKVGEFRLIDVLTCAAPNAGTFLRYNTGEGAATLNEYILAGRIKFIHEIFEYSAITFGVETIILGAWGCGVFRQNPTTVAKLMMNEFKSSRLNRIIFGIPDNENYNIFEKTLRAVI